MKNFAFSVRNFEKAEVELDITRQLSLGKSWNVKSFLPEQTDSSNTLFMSANYLLHLCYMKQAQFFSKIDYHRALEFATLAKKRAVEGKRFTGFYFQFPKLYIFITVSHLFSFLALA